MYSKLSVVIPVFNERNFLREIIRQVVAVDVGMKKELILVDDYSTDGTRELYDQIRAEHPSVEFQVVLHDRNRGKGAALRSGFAKVTGDIIIIQDADLEYDPRDYPALVRPIMDGKADVVYGSRFIGHSQRRVLFFWHMVVNRIITLLSNMVTNRNFSDMETCYKVFTRQVLSELHFESDRFNFEPEITAKISRRNRAGKFWEIQEVPISYVGRTHEEGKKITWKDGVSAVWTIAKYSDPGLRFFVGGLLLFVGLSGLCLLRGILAMLRIH